MDVKLWLKILVAIASFLLAIIITLLLRPIILLIAPFIIAYILYRAFTGDWYTTVENIKAFFNIGTVIEEIYLIKNEGLLLFHYTRRLKPMVDQDILASMLSAITEFVKDAFKTQADLDEIRFRELEIQLARGRYVTMAVIISGRDKEGIRRQMRACVRDIEKNCKNVLENWNGDMTSVKVIEKYIKDFVRGKYGKIKTLLTE